MSTYHKCISALKSIKYKYPELLNEFIEWHKEGEWDEEGLIDEFTNDYEDCSFIDSMKDDNKIKTDTQAQEVWQILHNAITSTGSNAISFDPIDKSYTDTTDDVECKEFPLNNNTIKPNPSTTPIIQDSFSVAVKLLSTNITPKEHKKHIKNKNSPTKKRLKKQAPNLLPGKKKENPQDILYIEYIGYKNNNYPLLLHLEDTYVRSRVNKWVFNKKRPIHSKNKNPISKFFHQKCKNQYFKEFMRQKDSQKVIEFATSAIASYHTRMFLPFFCMKPVYKITDKNPMTLVKYIFEMAKIVRSVADMPVGKSSNTLPVQLDFMIINKDIVFNAPDPTLCQGIEQLIEPDSDDDDALFASESKTNPDDNEHNDDDNMQNDPEMNIADDIDALFKSKKMKYGTDFFAYDHFIRWQQSVEDMKTLTDNKRSKRNVFVLDRRQKKYKTDKLYLYKPKKYNEFEKNEQQLVHASLHYNSHKSMLPKDTKWKKGEDDYGVCHGLRGQMFVMSYHVLSKDEIRCYLYYQGQHFRFFGEDLINVLPSFFFDDRAVEKTLLNEVNKQGEFRKQFEQFCSTFTDNKFDNFYYGLTGKNVRIGNIIPKGEWKSLYDTYRNPKTSKLNTTVPVSIPVPIKPSESKPAPPHIVDSKPALPQPSLSNESKGDKSMNDEKQKGVKDQDLPKQISLRESHSIDAIEMKLEDIICEEDITDTATQNTKNVSQKQNKNNVTDSVFDIDKTIRSKYVELLKKKVHEIMDDDQDIQAPDGVITEYAGGNSNKGSKSYSNNNSGSGNGGYGGGYGGGGGYGSSGGGGYGLYGGYGGSTGGDGDDDKNNERDHSSEDKKKSDDDEDTEEDEKEEEHKEEKEEEEEEEEDNYDCSQQVDKFFDILNKMKMQDINDNDLPNMLSSFSPKVFSKVSKGIDELNEEIQRISSAWNALNKPTKQKQKPKQKPKQTHKQLMGYKRKKSHSLSMKNSTTENTPEPTLRETTPQPKTMKTKTKSINYCPTNIKSKYFIPRKFTEKILPSRVKEDINMEKNAAFDFTVKSLAINDKNNWKENDKLIFNFDLHDKNNPKENVYVVAKYQNPNDPKNRGTEWLVIDVCTKNEITTQYNISPSRLPSSMIFNELNKMKHIEQIVNDTKKKIIQKTRWNKIQIFNRVNNKRRLTLSLSNPEFIASCKKFIQENVQEKIKLIPIIMFDRYEQYCIEYIWIVSIETGMNIGISLKYNKDIKSVSVNGIHLDKMFIYKQHILISPSHQCNHLNGFQSYITDLHIGNPDDNINKIKDLQNRLYAVKQENCILNQKINNDEVYSPNGRDSIHSNTLPLISDSSGDLPTDNNYRYPSDSDLSSNVN